MRGDCFTLQLLAVTAVSTDFIFPRRSSKLNKSLFLGKGQAALKQLVVDWREEIEQGLYWRHYLIRETDGMIPLTRTSTDFPGGLVPELSQGHKGYKKSVPPSRCNYKDKKTDSSPSPYPWVPFTSQLHSLHA